MESRRQKIPENRLTNVRRIARAKASKNAKESSETIPIDLIFEILLRLPARSVARCRCVSKPWASMLRLPSFTELYLTRSHTQPQLLFAVRDEYHEKVLFFTSPQSLNLDENSSPVVANLHMRFKFHRIVDISSPIRGLICFRDKRVLKGRMTQELVTTICKLSTGQCFTLPRMKTRRKVGLESFFGYDPIGKHLKVVSLTSNINGGRDVESEEHQIMTLGARESSWRMIECDISHIPKRVDIVCTKRDVICINGVLYYVAAPELYSRDPFLVCFDVRTEKYSYVEVPENSVSIDNDGATLMNYFGKLAALKSEEYNHVSGRSRSFKMFVLEDPEEDEWSTYVYKLPTLWRNVVGNTPFDFVGMTTTNEILLCPVYSANPFYVYYYSLERQSIRRVEIQGLSAVRGHNTVYAYMDHVEDVKLMQAL